MKKIVVSDFDGTISKVDMGVAILDKFAKGNWKEIENLWHERKISSSECIKREFELVDVKEDRLRGFVESFEIDKNFIDFLKLCKKNGIDFLIVSDGGDYYIKIFLKKYKLEKTKFIANKMYFKNNRIQFKFLSQNKECNLCANCKKIEIEKLKKRGYEKIIYIGDGYSDRCVIESGVVDFVFAKGLLLKFCKKTNLNFLPFSNFKDIIENFHLIK